METIYHNFTPRHKITLSKKLKAHNWNKNTRTHASENLGDQKLLRCHPRQPDEDTMNINAVHTTLSFQLCITCFLPKTSIPAKWYLTYHLFLQHYPELTRHKSSLSVCSNPPSSIVCLSNASYVPREEGEHHPNFVTHPAHPCARAHRRLRCSDPQTSWSTRLGDLASSPCISF